MSVIVVTNQSHIVTNGQQSGTVVVERQSEIVSVERQTQVIEAGQQGPPGVDAVGQRTFSFSWGDATPLPLITVLSGQMVLGVTISLDVPFNGVGAALSVGDAIDDGSLLDADMVDPTIIGAFQNAPCRRYLTATQILLTITPGTGASTGSGVVSLYLE